MANSAENSAGEQVEYGTALATLIVDDRSAVALVRSLPRRQMMPIRATKSVGVKHRQHRLITALFIQQ